MTIDKARHRRVLARWHRRLAVAVAIWLLALAASGIVINHAHDWGLDKKPLSALLQLRVYGIEKTGEDFCERMPALGPDCTDAFARLPLPAGEILLTENSIYLVDDSGQLLEKLAVSHFGLGSLQAVLGDDVQIFLRDSQKVVAIDPDLMDWVDLSLEAAGALSNRNWQERGNSVDAITWERFFLDLHAARFLGPLAKVFTDLMAALILVLVASGIWLSRLKRNGNGNGNGNGPSR